MAYFSADLRKWLYANTALLLGRNIAGIMKECKFPCFSIKPSACQKENHTSKKRWRPGIINRRSYTDISSCKCTVVESFLKRGCQFHISFMRLTLWIWNRASRLYFLTFKMSGLVFVNAPVSAHMHCIITVSNVSDEEIGHIWRVGYFKQHQLRF